jgi:hypothetical protein
LVQSHPQAAVLPDMKARTAVPAALAAAAGRVTVLAAQELQDKEMRVETAPAL